MPRSSGKGNGSSKSMTGKKGKLKLSLKTSKTTKQGEEKNLDRNVVTPDNINKTKQFGKAEGSRVRKRKLNVQGNDQEKGEVTKRSTVSAKFFEEGDIVEFEVDVQSTDFTSETEEGEVANSSDSEMEGTPVDVSVNNNASVAVTEFNASAVNQEPELRGQQ